MPRELISKSTRREFREWLVGWTLRTISDLFDNHNIRSISLPEDQLPSGQRRSIVECYYASIDWSNPQDVRRMLDAYEDILIGIHTTCEERKQKLIRYLERDGYTYDGRRIVSQALDTALVDTIPTVGLDTEHLHIYVDRINASIKTDPSLAIGSTKDLIEGTLKTILKGYNLEYDDGKDDIPKLLKLVQKYLELVPDDVDGSRKGAEVIKRVLNNLGSVAVGVAELRNLYGSGHGKGKKSQGLTSRHAKLVVGSGTTLCAFLLETYEHRSNDTLARLRRKQWQHVHTLSIKPPRKVLSIDIDPTGRTLASGGEDHQIKIWDLNKGELSYQYDRCFYDQSSGDVDSLVFNHDGKFIISTGHVSCARDSQNLEQQKIQVLDWETGEVICFLSSSLSPGSGSSVAICPNDNVLACDSRNNIQLYNFRTRRLLNTLKGHLKKVESITFSPNGEILASGSQDGQIRICNWRTGNLLGMHSENSAAVNTVAISPDNKILASGSNDSTVVLFNLITKRVDLKLNGHLAAVNSVNFSPDGLILASGSKDDTIKLWHVKTGELLHTLEGNSCWKGVWSVIFSPDGQILAAGLEGGEIRTWHRS
jgi:WD40 repeat protein